MSRSQSYMTGEPCRQLTVHRASYPTNSQINMSNVSIRQPVRATKLTEAESPIEDDTSPSAARTEDVFPQSVASGGPTPGSVILWTRINPDRYEPSESLYLEVATDPSFEKETRAFEFDGPGVKPPDNYTVRVDLDYDAIDADSVYYYRFVYRGVHSNTGRCRTLPAEDSEPESIRFGVLNCQNYQNGYFSAMAHLAETDVDFVLHLGDYIYEHVADGDPKSGEDPYTDRQIDLPDSGTRPMSLDDFRHIYEIYKADRHLQRLHENHTVIQTWDDHAIANDRYWDYDADAPVFPDHPCGDVPEFTRYLTSVGIQAWWEFIPGRIKYDPSVDHIHESFTLYRSLQFGDLITLALTDERLFRSEPRSWPAELFNPWSEPDPPRTMLGEAQHRWLCDTFRESETVWTAWANAVLFKRLYFLGKGLIFWEDAWSGFASERQDIIKTLTTVRERGNTNVVTLTGDMHMTLATRLLNEQQADTPVGVEFMTPSVTSVNPCERAIEIGQQVGLGREFGQFVSWLVNGVSTSRVADCASDAGLLPDFALSDGSQWGFSVITFSRDDLTWDVYWVDKTEDSADSECDPAYRIYLPTEEYTIHERHEMVPDLRNSL